MADALTFGATITGLRKRRGLNQRDLAARIQKEDGGSISQQYLADIENGRRNPSGDHIITQLATALEEDPAFLAYVAGQLPNEVRDLTTDPQRFRAALEKFREALAGQEPEAG